MKKTFTKISLFIITGIFISACVADKRVPSGKKLLTKDEIVVNDKKVSTDVLTNQLYQKPNSKILGVPLSLYIYNLANLKHDSLYKAKFVKDPEKYAHQSKLLSAKQVNRLGESFLYAGIPNFFEETGEPPVIIEEKSAVKSIARLKAYYFNEGYFNVKTSFKIDSIAPKKGSITYTITTGNPFIIDTLKTKILTPALDSIYQKNKANSILKVGNQYNKDNIDKERNRITNEYRNNGVFYFQQNNVNFVIDTIGKKDKAKIDIKIDDYSYRVGDSTKTEHFKIYKISDVNIYTDYSTDLNNPKKGDSTMVRYENFNLFSTGKLRYKPFAITDAVFITKGSLFSDMNTALTSRYINNLKIFNYPTIQYNLDPKDSLGQSLIANIYLRPKKKYGLNASLDLNHSNIQDIGIAGSASLSIRNVFNRAETFQISAQAIIGSSRDLANPGDPFFNTAEYALDLKLIFPRILMFFNTDKIIPKSMIPSTTLSAGYGKQTNVGLDKENFSTILSYNWTIKKNTTARFDLFNLQYIKNINTSNYFYVYGSSYQTLNDIAQPYQSTDPEFYEDGNLIIESGTNGFLEAVLGPEPTIILPEDQYNTVFGINTQKDRLTENNMIFATNFSFAKVTKNDITDENYHGYKAKIESAGLIPSIFTINQTPDEYGYKTILGVEYSQYIKTEFEYIKHWDLNHNKVLAFRTFMGIAIPYGNSDYIPFTRSYYAGGSNDNRAWLAYSLGPGSSNTIDNFNEANLKIAFNLEYRFKILGSFDGALFIDAGNIWNVFENTAYEEATFTSMASLEDIAIGSGFGLRYDFSFFVFRLDFGFKTYNPADNGNKKWFYDYNFGNSVVNIGINYPF